MLLFITGPMSGHEDWNAHTFNATEDYFVQLDYKVCNPINLFISAEHGLSDFLVWEECMKITIPELCKCEGIIVLNGWEKSTGACMEVFLASKLKMRFFNQLGIDITRTIRPPSLILEGLIK